MVEVIDMTTYNIYKITNNINQKVYIGQTIKPIEKRFKEHCKQSSCCIFLKNAINKYGKNNFKIELIDTTDNDINSDLLEQKYIELYNSTNKEFGYNISLGGRPTMRGRKHTNETKEKISKANKGKKASEELRKQLSEMLNGENHPNWNKHLSEETKSKISNSNKGKIPSEETKAKILAAKVGYKHQEETKSTIVSSSQTRKM